MDLENSMKLKAARRSYEDGRVEDARNQLLSVLENDPDSAPALVSLGTIYFEREDAINTLKYYNKAVLSDPNNLLAFLGLGAMLSKQNDFKQASEAYAKAAEIDINSSAAHYGLAFCLDKLGQYKSAIDELHTAIRLEPQNAAAYNLLGSVLRKEGKIQEAIDQYQVAMSIDPTYSKPLYNYGNAILELSKFHPVSHQQYLDAKAALEKSIELSPRFAPAYFVLGGVNINLRDFHNAEKAFRTAISLSDAPQPSYYHSLIKLLLKRYRFQTALRTIKDYLHSMTLREST